MTPKSKVAIKNLFKTDEEFGIEILKRSDIPSPQGRGRLALIPQLTIAKVLHKSLESIAENGIGVSEEVCGFNLEAPATQKEAAKLGIKKIASSFASFVKKQLEEYKLTGKVEVIRREGGKKLYIVGPQVD